MVIELIGAVLRPLHHLLHIRSRENISGIEMEEGGRRGRRGRRGEDFFDRCYILREI